jgi:CDP-diacylglycerol--serine O-phosphatidyltransferase
MPYRRRWDDNPPERKRRFRKGIHILPSIFTAANIGAGYYAISQTFQGGAIAQAFKEAIIGNRDFDPATVASMAHHFDLAALAIGVAVVADGLDGRIARMTNTASDFGREFDSLADVITFGLAPALLAWVWGFRMLPDIRFPELHLQLVQLGLVATFIFLVAGASRLARFNIQTNPQPSNPGRPDRKYFVGMPIPAGAGVLASVVHFAKGHPLNSWWLAPFWLLLIVIVGLLMVSTWRFSSFKELHLGGRHQFQTLVLVCGVLALIWFFSQYVLLTIGVTYMLSGIITRFLYFLRRRRTETVYKEIPEAR